MALEESNNSQAKSIYRFATSDERRITNVLSDGGMVGDVDVASAREVAGAITPVPGGVGPLTNVLPLKQCVQAAWQLADEKKEVKTAA